MSSWFRGDDDAGIRASSVGVSGTWYDSIVCKSWPRKVQLFFCHSCESVSDLRRTPGLRDHPSPPG